MEKFFALKQNNTSVKKEIIAGITTFMTMAYILAVNPSMLSLTGMDIGGVFTATALSAMIATLIMGVYVNYPFALASGMGLNAFFTFTVVLGMGKSWQFALTAILIEGLIFILLSAIKVREAIFNAIPLNLKHAVSAGIGLFIAFIGVTGAGIVQTGNGTIVGLGTITSGAGLLTLIGLIITTFLLSKRITGAILIGIIITTIIGIPMGVTILPENFTILSMPPSVGSIAFQFVGFEEIFSFEMLIVIFTFLFVDIFDTVGTLTGISSRAGMIDSKGKLPRVGKALLTDAIGTVIGACLGTSTVTTYIESASGIAEGGRTGLTAVSTAAMFGIALFFAPLFIMIPSAATAPALIIVGLFMMESVLKIDFSDFTEAIPAFLTIIMMPFAYSIADGIVFGMVSYVVLKLITGRTKEISKTMLAIAILFILKFIWM